MNNDTIFQNDFRTYRRRSVTRNSGYHVCENTTGGECIIKNSTKLILPSQNIDLVFKSKNFNFYSCSFFSISFLINLFTSGLVNINKSVEVTTNTNA